MDCSPRPRIPRPLIVLLLLGACTGAQAAGLPTLPAYVTPGQKYQMALEARTVRAYPEMFRLLRQAAEAGDVESQELLGSLLLAGPALLGPKVKADPCEAGKWINRAWDQGSIVAGHQKVVLNGMMGVPGRWASCREAGPTGFD